MNQEFTHVDTCNVPASLVSSVSSVEALIPLEEEAYQVTVALGLLAQRRVLQRKNRLNIAYDTDKTDGVCPFGFFC